MLIHSYFKIISHLYSFTFFFQFFCNTFHPLIYWLYPVFWPILEFLQQIIISVLWDLCLVFQGCYIPERCWALTRLFDPHPVHVFSRKFYHMNKYWSLYSLNPSSWARSNFTKNPNWNSFSFDFYSINKSIHWKMPFIVLWPGLFAQFPVGSICTSVF